MALKIAILASGSGTNAQAIIDKIKAGVLNASVRLIFSNKKNARVLCRAVNENIPAEWLDIKDFRDRVSYDRAVLKLLAQHGCEAAVLAGYMRLLSGEFLKEFAGPVLNIHPALLPSFPGVHGISDAFEYGARLTGPSVHFVEEKMDAGPLIIQAALPVRQDENLDALEGRIHALEHRIYPQALQWLAEGRLKLSGRKVLLQKGKSGILPPEDGALIWPPLEEGF